MEQHRLPPQLSFLSSSESLGHHGSRIMDDGWIGRGDTGSAGKVTNCQIGVFAAYVSRHGHAFVDRALYLPQSWTKDPARMAGAHVPLGTAFSRGRPRPAP